MRAPDERPRASDLAARQLARRGGRPRRQPADFQRMRIHSAMITVACEQGVQAATVGEVVAQAGISRKTFYEFFDDRADCLLASLECIVALVGQRARDACERERSWRARIRAALQVILEYFDEEPAIARLCVVESAAAGPAVLARRRELLDHLAQFVAEGRTLTRGEQPPLAAQGAVGGAFEVIHARLLKPDGRALVEQLGPLTSFIVLPYLGAGAAARELHRPLVAARPATDKPASASGLIEVLPIRLTYRTATVLAVIAAQPGLSNIEISKQAGVVDQGQISKLLARLAGVDLAENLGGGQNGAPNAWRLTDRGASIERMFKHECLNLAGGPAGGGG